MICKYENAVTYTRLLMADTQSKVCGGSVTHVIVRFEISKLVQLCRSCLLSGRNVCWPRRMMPHDESR